MVKIGFKTSQTNVDWPTLLATWELADVRIVAELADGWNQTGDPATFVEKRDALLRHCEVVGRDPGEIEISAQAFLRDGYAASLEVAATYARQGAHHVMLVIPADHGPEGLQRLAHEVAEPLRERFG